MRTKTIMLCTVSLTLGACAQSGSRYTPRADIYQNNYTQKERTQDRMDKKSYTEYEQREQCQGYRAAPRNYSDGCVNNMMKEEVVIAVAPKPASPKKAVLPIVSSYTILFDLNKSTLRAGENKTLDKALNEFNQCHPTQVTVTGYTDSSGTAEYNQGLSRKREEAVSKALSHRGIESRTIKREALGEYDQAVKTANSVRNQKNRRVVIDFRR